MSSCIGKIINLKPDSSPPDWKILFLLAATNTINVIVIAYTSTFLPNLVLYLGYEESDKGYYVGIISGSQFIGRVFGSIFWGWLADKYGRRKILLITLFLCSFITLAFGFALSLTMVILMRFLSGVSNGILGLSKVIIHDKSDENNQALMMSSITFSFGLGTVLSPLIGGFLSQPITQYPSAKWFHFELFKTFPFILPSFVSCILSLLVFILVFFQLEETKMKEIICEEIVVSDLFINDVEDQTIENVIANKTSSNSVNCSKRIENNSSEIQLKYAETNQKNDNPDDPRKDRFYDSITLLGSSVLMESGFYTQKNNGNESKGKRCFNGLKQIGMVAIMTDKICLHVIVASSIHAMANMSFYQLMTVWESTPQSLDGLEFEPRHIGLADGITSTGLLFTQVCFFTWIEQKLGSLRVTIYLTVVNIVIYLITPQLHFLVDYPILMWIILEGLQIPGLVNYITTLGTLSIITNNSVEAHNVGIMNGLSITFSCIARALGPVICGVVYSWTIRNGKNNKYPLDHNFAFLLISFMLIIFLVVVAYLPESLNKRRTNQK